MGALGLDVVHVDEVVAIARWKTIHLTNFRSKIRAESVLRAIQDFEKLAKAHPGERLGTVMVIEPNLPLPDPDLRSIAIEANRKLHAYEPYSAAALLGEGFWVSAARSVLTAILIAARRQTYAAGSIEQACNWVCLRVGRLPSDVPALVDAIAELRSIGPSDATASGTWQPVAAGSRRG
jgi:hypothetical protein